MVTVTKIEREGYDKWFHVQNEDGTTDRLRRCRLESLDTKEAQWTLHADNSHTNFTVGKTYTMKTGYRSRKNCLRRLLKKGEKILVVAAAGNKVRVQKIENKVGNKKEYEINQSYLKKERSVDDAHVLERFLLELPRVQFLEPRDPSANQPFQPMEVIDETNESAL